MKKHRKLLAVILSLAMILTLVPLALFASAEDEYVPYINADGTVNTATGNYTISSIKELTKLASKINAGNSYADSNFRLEFVDDETTTDVDETGIVDLTGVNWSPIGERSGDHPFSGTFDGNGHTIIGMNVGTEEEPATSQFAGFFGYVYDGTVKNLAIKDSKLYVTGLLTQIGPVVASLEEGTVSGCAVQDVTIDVEYTGTIITANAVGGLVGTSTNGTIQESYSTAHITVTAPNSMANYIGGLVGRNGGTVSSTYYAGNVSLGESLIGVVGGLVGNNSGTIENSYSVGLVGGKMTAGIAGVNSGTITNCYYYEGSASAGAYAVVEDETNSYEVYETEEIETFSTSNFDSTFAAKLNGALESITGNGAFTGGLGLGDSVSDLLNSNTYPFPTLANNVFVMSVPKQDTDNFAGGSGTIYDPYQIATTAHLNNVRYFLSDAFILNNDIVFVDYEYATQEQNIEALKKKLSTDDLAAIYAIVNPTEEETTTTTTTAEVAQTPEAPADGESAEESSSSTEPSSSETSEEPSSEEGGETDPETPATTIDIETLDVSTLTETQKTEIEAIMGDLDTLEAGAFVGGFSPIGAVADPFVGNFDGNGKVIYNIDITSEGTYAALFVRNLGTITDLVIDQKIVENAANTKYSDVATTPARVTLVTDGASGAYAAAISAMNNGTINAVTADMDVTAKSADFKSYVAGLVAINTGSVVDSQNSGIILAKFSDYTTKTYTEIANSADIKVAGAVAVNQVAAIVDGCYSNASARSEFTSASDTDAIMEDAYIADNQSDATVATAADAVTISDTYLTYDLPDAYAHPATEYSAEAGLADPATGAALVPDATLTPEVEYSEVNENYQLVTITYNDAYTTSFLAWLQLDTSKMAADVEGADKEFIKGEAFSSDGIKVTANDGALTLSEVSDEADNGYVVKVYSRTENTPAEEGAETTYEYTEITDLSTQPAGTYYVKVTYGGTEINGGSYEIKVCDIAKLVVESTYTTHMVGQSPSLDVTAIYSDTAETEKTLDSADYNYYITTSKDDYTAITKDTVGELTANSTFTATGTAYVGAIYDNGTTLVKSVPVEIKVLAADVKVSDLTVTTSSSENSEVKADKIRLSWTDEDAPQYRVYRSTDGGETWIKKASPRLDLYLDSGTEAGETYIYKVYMVVAGEESAGYQQVTATAPIPETVTADVTGAEKYIGLYNDFESGSINVTATYKNDTTERISAAEDSDTAKHSKYYFDLTDFNSDLPGTYTIGIMYNYADGAETIATYDVTVVAPESIAAEAGYTYYPEGYDVEKFKESLTVEATYPQDTISGKLEVGAEDYSINSYDSSITTEARTITVNYTSYTNAEPPVEKPLTANVSVNFVPNVAPSTVAATAGSTGINTVEWSSVTGAVAYNIYRATTDGVYEIIDEVELKEADTTDANTYKIEDDTALPGTEYTYKVSAVIAEQETDLSVATNAIVTVAPEFIKATFADDFDKEYAVGQRLRVDDVTVKAYYPVPGYTAIDLDADFATVETSTNYTSRELTKSKNGDGFNYYYTTEYDKSTAGTYTVSITYAGLTEYKGQVIGEIDVTVYPIYKLTAETNEAKYEIGTEFTTEDITATAYYGYVDGDKETTLKSADLKADEFIILNEPDMSLAAAQTVTIALATDDTVKADLTVVVYDPDNMITVKDESVYVDDTENNFIANIQPTTTVDTLKENLENDEATIQVVDKNDTEKAVGSALATGDKVQLVVGDTVLDERVIVVLGDVDGNGKVNGLDYRKVLNVAAGKATLDGVFEEAADVNGTNSINGLDYRKVLNYAAGKATTI